MSSSTLTGPLCQHGGACDWARSKSPADESHRHPSTWTPRRETVATRHRPLAHRSPTARSPQGIRTGRCDCGARNREPDSVRHAEKTGSQVPQNAGGGRSVVRPRSAAISSASEEGPSGLGGQRRGQCSRGTDSRARSRKAASKKEIGAGLRGGRARDNASTTQPQHCAGYIEDTPNTLEISAGLRRPRNGQDLTSRTDKVGGRCEPPGEPGV